MPPALRGNKRDQRVGNSPQSDDSGWGAKAPRTPSTFGLRAEGSFHLASKPVLLVAIAGREVEGDKSRNARSPCDVTGLTCRKMPPLCGNLHIRVKKRRLDEELISTACQRHDPVDVLVVISGVDYIGNLLSPRRAQRMLLEHGEGEGKVVPNNNSLLSGSPRRTARLASLSHGPTPSPSDLRPSLHTLTRSFSSNAKARHGVP